MQKTFGLIKPDVISRGIIKEVINNLIEMLKHVKGFKFQETGVTTMTEEEAKILYGEHQSKAFFKDMINFIANKELVMIIMEGENIIDEYRKVMGATNPKDAIKDSLRGMFGISIDENSFHGSDSEISADREINIFQYKFK